MTALAPQLIVINGTSSTGKTTLARATQAAWPTPMIYLGLDAWITMTLAEKYWEQATCLSAIKTDAFVRQGTHFLAPNTEANPSAWPQIASGPLSDAAVFAMHDTALNFLTTGISVILDCVLLKAAWREDLLQKMQTQQRCFIHMHAAEAILAEREQARGNRMANVFRSLLPIVHRDLHYDLMIDSGVQTTPEAVIAIMHWLKQRKS